MSFIKDVTYKQSSEQNQKVSSDDIALLTVQNQRNLHFPYAQKSQLWFSSISSYKKGLTFGKKVSYNYLTTPTVQA